MEKIQLTRGQYAIIDDEDLDIVREHQWLARRERGKGGFSARRTIVVSMEYIIMRKCLMSDEYVYHKNSDKLDNRKSNLVIRKRNKRSKETSEYQGVSFDKKNRKWRARINPKGKHISLGSFHNELDAAKAYNRAAIKYFGKFANLNKV